MAQDLFGDFDHVAREPARYRRRCARVRAEFLRDRHARCEIDRVDQPQHQLGVVALFLGAVRGLLHIKIGEYAHQRRTDVDAVAPRKAIEALQLGKHRRHNKPPTSHSGLRTHGMRVALPR